MMSWYWSRVGRMGAVSMLERTGALAEFDDGAVKEALHESVAFSIDRAY